MPPAPAPVSGSGKHISLEVGQFWETTDRFSKVQTIEKDSVIVVSWSRDGKKWFGEEILPRSSVSIGGGWKLISSDVGAELLTRANRILQAASLRRQRSMRAKK